MSELPPRGFQPDDARDAKAYCLIAFCNNLTLITHFQVLDVSSR